ncbi:N-acetyltransferase OS=Stutzerimonas stutzeri OX=316 GN=CXK95_11925 PE=4 SV=1 [Stutzerimonas stutzeri]
MFTPRPLMLQRGALRLEPMVEADIPPLVSLAEANREELMYMNGPLRPDWYRHALAEQREERAVVFTVRLAERIVGTTRFADFMPSLPAAELGWTCARPRRAR